MGDTYSLASVLSLSQEMILPLDHWLCVLVVQRCKVVMFYFAREFTWHTEKYCWHVLWLEVPLPGQTVTDSHGVGEL